MKTKSKQELSHSAKCLFCALAKDQSCCCQTAVRKRCCSAQMPSLWWDCSPRGLNQHLGQRTGSRAELFRYASLRAGQSPGTGPAEASRELCRMFLCKKNEEVRPKHRQNLESSEDCCVKTYPWRSCREQGTHGVGRSRSHLPPPQMVGSQSAGGRGHDGDWHWGAASGQWRSRGQNAQTGSSPSF